MIDHAQAAATAPTPPQSVPQAADTPDHRAIAALEEEVYTVVSLNYGPFV